MLFFANANISNDVLFAIPGILAANFYLALLWLMLREAFDIVI